MHGAGAAELGIAVLQRQGGCPSRGPAAIVAAGRFLALHCVHEPVESPRKGMTSLSGKRVVEYIHEIYDRTILLTKGEN